MPDNSKRKFRVGWLALFFAIAAIAIPILLARCGPSAEEQCDALVARTAVSTEVAQAQNSLCLRDARIRHFMPCALAPHNYNQLIDCAQRNNVSFGTPSARATVARESEPEPAPPSQLPKDSRPPKLTHYVPRDHGFQFINDLQVSPGVFGVCEGMSYGSLDYYRRGMERPLIAGHAPMLPEWNDLERWIIARQREAAWKNWALYVDRTWVMSPFEKSRSSLAAWNDIKSKLDHGEPVLVGLMPISSAVWEAHAVVAWSYLESKTEDGKQILYLWIYDPNHPDHNNVWLEAVPDTIFFWQEYDNWKGYRSETWTAIAPLEYEDPGQQAGFRVPSVFTEAQIHALQPGYLAIGADWETEEPEFQYLTAGMAFPTDSRGSYALGGYRENTVQVTQRHGADFKCDLRPGPRANCYPRAEMLLNELFSGLAGTVRPDGSYCRESARGTVIPDGEFIRFSPRSDCPSSQPPPPPPGGGHTGGHVAFVRLEDIDDDAYAWIDSIGPLSNAVCSAKRATGGAGACEVTHRLHGNQTIVWFKIGNHGCLNSHGTVAIEIDGVRVWEGREVDDKVKHCGWTFRARVPVDIINGRIDERQVIVESCFNVGDCND